MEVLVLYNIVKSNVNYTEQQAKEIALSQVPGQVVYVTKDIDLDHLGLEYNIKIKDKNNIIREVTLLIQNMELYQTLKTTIIMIK
ncbi:MAG: hypothetical protein U0Z74_00140 [Romboutsia timonensis]